MKRILFIVATTIVTIAGFTFFTNFDNAEAHESHDEHNHEEEVDFDNILLTPQQLNTADIRMGEVVVRQLDAMLQANGQLVLRSQNVGNVASLMGGVVKSILVKEGQTVSKGQVVATIENTDIVALQREYFTACKEAEQARIDVERQQQLQQGGAGVKKTLQLAQKELRVAEASVASIGQQLRQMGVGTGRIAKGIFTTVFPVHAPISGTVSQLSASLGSYADMQTPLMQIRNNSAMEADLNIFERDLPKVKIGDRVILTLTNQPGVSLSGRIYGINSYFNDGTKTVAAHVRLDAVPTIRLVDGMFVSGKVAISTQRCETLPTNAIVTSEGKKYIFILNSKSKGGYSFSRHEVTPGVVQDGYTEVKLCEHVGKGRKVVVDNAFYLASLTGEHGEHTH